MNRYCESCGGRRIPAVMHNCDEAVAVVDRDVTASEVEIQNENAKFRYALKQIIAHAGHPNASEGCRIIIKVAKEALEGS